MPDEPLLPTEEELRKLPRWARVAYAARCALRVLPLFEAAWPEALERDRNAVEWAIIAAARAARAARADGDEAFFAGAAAEAREAAHLAAGLDSRAYYAADAARAAADAARAADAAHAAIAAHAVTNAYAAARAAAGADVETSRAMQADYDLLCSAAQLEHWTDDTPIPQEIFGPLWPEGPPPAWPKPEPESDVAELVLTIDVPEGIADEDVVGLVAELVKRADAMHRAYGGHGLEIEEGNVEIEREAPQPIPVGGPS
jgi:hypothetical protein